MRTYNIKDCIKKDIAHDGFKYDQVEKRRSTIEYYTIKKMSKDYTTEKLQYYGN